MNKLMEVLNIKYPIIQGGMGNISNAILTSSISNARGLGTIGVGTMTPTEIEQILAETSSLTSYPFAVNIPLSVSSYIKEILLLLVKYKVPIVSLSAGNPAPYIPFLKENGLKVICVVASVKQAIKAELAGADIIVAEGYEAAGINSNLESTTLTLIPQIVSAVTVPVVAAGGIGDGKGLAAMLALGASGVQMGTRFIATKEAPFHQNYKGKLLQSNDTDTVIVGRTVGKIRRLMNTPYAQKLLQFEKEGISLENFDLMTTEEQHRAGAIEGNLENGFINGGQISGYIDDIPSVEELLTRMMSEAKEQISYVSTLL